MGVQTQCTPVIEEKYVEKVFNWSEVHLSEMTCYKIHTLGPIRKSLLCIIIFVLD